MNRKGASAYRAIVHMSWCFIFYKQSINKLKKLLNKGLLCCFEVNCDLYFKLDNKSIKG